MIVDSCTLTMEDDLDMMEVDQNSLIPSNNNKGAGNDDHDRSRSMIAIIMMIDDRCWGWGKLGFIFWCIPFL